MILLVKESIHRSGGDDLQFFQTCYFWKFNKHQDVWGDILAYRTQYTIPQYVIDYVQRVYGIQGG